MQIVVCNCLIPAQGLPACHFDTLQPYHCELYVHLYLLILSDIVCVLL